MVRLFLTNTTLTIKTKIIVPFEVSFKIIGSTQINFNNSDTWSSVVTYLELLKETFFCSHYLWYILRFLLASFSWDLDLITRSICFAKQDVTLQLIRFFIYNSGSSASHLSFVQTWTLVSASIYKKKQSCTRFNGSSLT